jgi:hypothetical protein
MNPSIGAVAHLIGKEGLLASNEGFYVPVKVLDISINFGRVDCTVTPVGGKGTAKVSAERIKFRKEE